MQNVPYVQYQPPQQSAGKPFLSGMLGGCSGVGLGCILVPLVLGVIGMAILGSLANSFFGASIHNGGFLESNGSPPPTPKPPHPAAGPGSLNVTVAFSGQPVRTAVLSGFTCVDEHGVLGDDIGPTSKAISAPFDDVGTTVAYTDITRGGHIVQFEIVPVQQVTAMNPAVELDEGRSRYSGVASTGSYTLTPSAIVFSHAQFELYYGAGKRSQSDANGFIVVDGTAPTCQS